MASNAKKIEAPVVSPAAPATVTDKSLSSNSERQAYFLPYQVAWLNDNSKYKIAEKSRRIGWTYVQSYEDVRDCVSGAVPAVWFSSADLSAAAEYIRYCEQWAKMFDTAARNLGEIALESDKDIKTFVIEFANGTRIHAMSSNPKSFRSKGGKVVLDEFGWHDDDNALWAAAKPAVTWGYPLRVFSTHNGPNSLFNRFIERVKKGTLKWSLHTTSIYKAVEEGLLDRIMGRPTTKEEREAWLAEERASCVDEGTWDQEYCCKPSDENAAFLTYAMIATCERDSILMPLEDTTGNLYLGMDIARKKDLSVIWIDELLGETLYTRHVAVLEKMKFSDQRKILYSFLEHPRLRRACIDQTGIGMQLTEEAKEKFGSKVEGVTFTGPIKESLAYALKSEFEDRNSLIPNDPQARESLHSVKKITTSAGNIRFDAAHSEQNGHGDHFWAKALAVHGARNKASGPTFAHTRKHSHRSKRERRRERSKSRQSGRSAITNGY